MIEKENECLMQLDVPEFWYEHDENGKRISLSFIGSLAVFSVGIAVARSIANIYVDEVLRDEK